MVIERPRTDMSGRAPRAPADRSGADQPLEERVADLRARLIAAVTRVCPRWLASHAEDIVQTAVAQLLARAQRGGGFGDLSSMYLLKVAHGAVVDEIRRHCRRAETLEDERTNLATMSATTPDPERSRRASEIGEAIADCLARLARPRRVALTLHLKGFTTREAAEQLAWGYKRTEHLVYRALADLRRCLAAKGLAP